MRHPYCLSDRWPSRTPRKASCTAQEMGCKFIVLLENNIKNLQQKEKNV